MNSIEKDIQQIIDYCHSFAERMLNESEEFYPFGVTIDNTGKLTPVGYEDKESDMPKSQKVIDELTNFFEAELIDSKIIAYGIASDVRVTLNEEGDKSDAIQIDIIHVDNNQLPRYYFPYSLNEQELSFGERFGINR